MQKAQSKYPLPEDERRALVFSALASEAMLLTAGVVVAVLLSLARGTPHALPLGWLSDVARAMGPHWTMIALPVVMLALPTALDALGMRFSPAYRDAMVDVRQGITGELPRLPFAQVAACMVAAGFCEELLFRYGLLSLAVWLLGLVLPPVAAMAVATVAVSVAFWLVHVQYRNGWAAAIVIGVSCLLCATYLATGSLLSVMFAHAVYNMGDILVERWKMSREPDYFDGHVPVDEALRMLRGVSVEANEGPAENTDGDALAESATPEDARA